MAARTFLSRLPYTSGSGGTSVVSSVSPTLLDSSFAEADGPSLPDIESKKRSSNRECELVSETSDNRGNTL